MRVVFSSRAYVADSRRNSVFTYFEKRGVTPYHVTLFHLIYNLLLEFSISLHGIRTIRNLNPKNHNPSPQSFLSSAAISPSTPKCRNLQSPSATTFSLKISPSDPRCRHLSYNLRVSPLTIFKCCTPYKCCTSFINFQVLSIRSKCLTTF